MAAMTSSAHDDASMRRVTSDIAIGDLLPRAAEERADFIRAVDAGLNDLESGREIPFDDTAIRLGLDRNDLPS